MWSFRNRQSLCYLPFTGEAEGGALGALFSLAGFFAARQRLGLGRSGEGGLVLLFGQGGPLRLLGQGVLLLLFRVGAPFAGVWAPVLNTDDAQFGGQGLGDHDPVKTEKVPCHDQAQSLVIDLPPMSAMIYRCTRRFPVRKPAAPKAEQAAAKKAAPKKRAAKAKAAAAPAQEAAPQAALPEKPARKALPKKEPQQALPKKEEKQALPEKGAPTR